MYTIYVKHCIPYSYLLSCSAYTHHLSLTLILITDENYHCHHIFAQPNLLHRFYLFATIAQNVYDVSGGFKKIC